jgi:hypothetical protein
MTSNCCQRDFPSLTPRFVAMQHLLRWLAQTNLGFCERNKD